MLEKGLKYRSETVVSVENCAMTMGSGNLPVFATPAMVALMENAAMQSVAEFLPDGSATVGGEISVKHLKPSKVGVTVAAEALLVDVSGRKLSFEVSAFEGETLIGKGIHTRFIVDIERFMQ